MNAEGPDDEAPKGPSPQMDADARRSKDFIRVFRGRAVAVCDNLLIAMSIELSKESRAGSIASIKRYFRENMAEEIGGLPAELLLKFFVEEIGPVIYNRAIADAQARMLQRVGDLEGDLYEEAFQYWPKIDRKRKK